MNIMKATSFLDIKYCQLSHQLHFPKMRKNERGNPENLNTTIGTLKSDTGILFMRGFSQGIQ